MFYTYILLNHQTGRYYVGYSSDLKNRLKQHCDGKVKSTKSNLNYELVWYCAFVNRDLALLFEKYLKSGSGIAFMKKRFFKSSVALVKRMFSLWMTRPSKLRRRSSVGGNPGGVTLRYAQGVSVP